MTNDRRTVLGWAQPYTQAPTQPGPVSKPEDGQLPPHLAYHPQPQRSQVAPVPQQPPRVPPYAAYDQPGYGDSDLAATQLVSPDPYVLEAQHGQPAHQPYPVAAYDPNQGYVQSYGSQPYPPQPHAAPQPWPGSRPAQPYTPSPPYPSAQPYVPVFAPQPQAPYARSKSPSSPPAASDVRKSDSKPLRTSANATVGSSVRLQFIRRTYLHLLGAILVFAGLEYLLMTNSLLIEKVSIPFTSFALGGRWNWGIVLAVFMVISWVADYWARHAGSRATQYLGLGLYVIAEAVIFVPLLAIVAYKTASILARGGGQPHILRDSALVTLALFGALTASVFLSRKDFSFLRSGLAMASAAALMLIVLSLVFGFNLGIVFSVAMVLLAAAYILYQTSQVLAHYDPDQHVSAALALFSSVALMFWYVIRIFMKMRE
ncbi:MAG: Bax inhibitor-1 family protein [Kofleriaceae bacterium]